MCSALTNRNLCLERQGDFIWSLVRNYQRTCPCTRDINFSERFVAFVKGKVSTSEQSLRLGNKVRWACVRSPRKSTRQAPRQLNVLKLTGRKILQVHLRFNSTNIGIMFLQLLKFRFESCSKTPNTVSNAISKEKIGW